MGAKVLCMRMDGCPVVQLIGLNAILFHVCQHLPHIHHLVALTPSSDEGCVGGKDGRQPCSFCILNQRFNTLDHSTLQLCPLWLCFQEPLVLALTELIQRPVLQQFDLQAAWVRPVSVAESTGPSV